MPLKPIPVKMERAKHPEIATRAMAIERDADSASVAQEWLKLRQPPRPWVFRASVLVSNIVLLRLRCVELQPSDTRSREGQGRAARSRFLTVPDPILTVANPILM
jgi:hypothetical protein